MKLINPVFFFSNEALRGFFKGLTWVVVVRQTVRFGENWILEHHEWQRRLSGGKKKKSGSEVLSISDGRLWNFMRRDGAVCGKLHVEASRSPVCHGGNQRCSFFFEWRRNSHSAAAAAAAVAAERGRLHGNTTARPHTTRRPVANQRCRRAAPRLEKVWARLVDATA